MSQGFDLVKTSIEAPETQTRFADMIIASRGLSRDKAKEEFQRESFQFKKMLLESPTLVNKNYSPISAMSVFLDVISAGLSFSSVQKHVYVLSRSVKTGKKTKDGKDIYEDRLYFTEQANGLIHLARQAKSIENVTQPTIVYADDFFENGNTNGEEWVNYKAGPGESDVIVAAFCHVISRDGKREAVLMKKRDWLRLAEFSKRQNSKWDEALKKKVAGDANALYSANNGQIDPGFLATKLVKKALRYRDKKSVTADTHIEDDDMEIVDTVDTAHEDVTGSEPEATQQLPDAAAAPDAEPDPF